jgi:dolichol-phosphate mannosyltransferase
MEGKNMVTDTIRAVKPAPEYQERNLFDAATQLALTIIVPTKNESGNINLLLERIEQALNGLPTEVIFVDDSTDDTPQVITALAEQFACLEVKLIHRQAEQRVGGLGGAVVEGMRAAQAPYVCVMDGDLQHPPELLPHLYQTAAEGPLDLVVASRRASNSNASGLNLARNLISRTLDLIARIIFPKQLHGVSDPLTGFFLVRLGAIDITRLHPEGFKILLEILVRNPDLRKGELPFHFGERHAGKSKASSKEALKYFYLLMKLRFGEKTVHFFEFALVGLSGILVNTLFMAIFTSLLGFHYLVSAFFATVGSSTWNYALTELWVFRQRKTVNGRFRRFALFFIMNNVALLFRGPIIYLLTSVVGIHYLISNVISLGILTVLRYLLADGWIWSKTGPTDNPLKTIKEG